MADRPAGNASKLPLDPTPRALKRLRARGGGVRKHARWAPGALPYDASVKRIFVRSARRQGDTVSVSATEAKDNFGRVLSELKHHDAVFITSNKQPQAVVISVERYAELTGEPAPDLDMLTEEFDALVAHMRTPRARKGTLAAIRSSSEELVRTAVLAAEGRG
jgi:prevent-host-death family protein